MQKNTENLELGQFIPLHYHYNMLNDSHRMKGFKAAIDLVVKPGARVLELGGGTGVQSFFAAQKAQQVYCWICHRYPAHDSYVSSGQLSFSNGIFHAGCFDSGFYLCKPPDIQRSLSFS